MDISSASQMEKSSGFGYVKNERMAGVVPVYNTPKLTESIGFGEVVQSFQEVEEPPIIEHEKRQDEGFGFFDLLDMINPFQHIPLVNLAYRAITGDEIKPISQIIGGGVFGGPLGVAGGIVNAVIEEETGKDAIGNAMAFVRPEKGVDLAYQVSIETERMAYDDLPVALLGFAEMPILESDVNQV
ncbi:MAG: hypothetical protein ACRBDI_05720 [Alphaproteobacteria bacterium]